MRAKHLLILAVFVGILLVGASGCSNKQPPQTNSEVTAATVIIKDFAFSPATIRVRAGTTVTWTNEDSAPHIVKSEGTFESATLKKGESSVFTFDKQGTFNYICAIHPSMTGQVIVE